jgi:excisionase family DNA binding protein
MMNPDEQSRLSLAVEEAAQRLGISRASSYEAVRRGEIPSIKIGRRTLVPVAALDALLASATARENRQINAEE